MNCKCMNRDGCTLGVLCEAPIEKKIFIDDCEGYKPAITEEDVYEYHFNQGRYHRSIPVEMSLPSAADDAVAFRGYMDGWGGSEYNMPVSPAILIDKLHKKGMVTVNE